MGVVVFGLFIIGLTDAVAADPIKIGIIKPLSGPVAYDGNNVVRGAQIAS